jgi:hypothetical protein
MLAPITTARLRAAILFLPVGGFWVLFVARPGLDHLLGYCLLMVVAT